MSSGFHSRLFFNNLKNQIATEQRQKLQKNMKINKLKQKHQNKTIKFMQNKNKFSKMPKYSIRWKEKQPKIAKAF